MQALAKADYRILHLIEDTFRSEGNANMNFVDKLKSADLQIDRIEIMQNRVIEFMIAQLSDNDQRIRNNAAAALVVLLPKLYFNSLFNKIGSGYVHSLHLAKDWKVSNFM